MTASKQKGSRAQSLAFLAAFATGGLLTLMVHFNGELAHYGNALFSSWVAHGTGTIAAMVLLAVLSRSSRASQPAVTASSGNDVAKAPLWAYCGGLSGALTVMLTSTAVNSRIGLSGTLALGLAGQVLFSLAADWWGFFGLPRQRPDLRRLLSLLLVIAGSGLIIFFGQRP